MTPMAATKSPRLRLDFIEGMRAVAALVVVVNHTYAQSWCEFYGQHPAPAFSFLSYSLAIGHLAVSVFIVISGFCLTIPVARGDGTLPGGTGEFFKKRARRILPPYYAALALSLLLIATVIGEPTGTLWDVAIQIRPTDLISHLLLFQHFFGTGRINYAFWSISLEWQLYFLFPLLVLLFRRWSAIGTVLAAMALGYFLVLVVGGRAARGNLHYLGLFTLGMLVSYVAFAREGWLARLRDALPWELIAGAILALATGLMAWWGWRVSIEHWPLLDLIVGTGTAALLLAATRAPRGMITRAFSWNPLVWVGKSSYSLYLIHAPLLQLLWLALRPFGLGSGIIFILLMTLGVPLILVAANLFYRVFEVPFMGSPKPRPVATPTVAAAE
jgi:peptidoglycan/LPS O-acetylase OafA/YrhL